MVTPLKMERKAAGVSRGISWVGGIAPFVLFLALVAFAVHVRLGLGHWPKPMWEKYQTPLSSAHELLLAGLLNFSLFVAPALWVASTALNYPDMKVPLKQLICYVAGWLLIIVAGSLDPTTFTAWLLD